MHAMHPFRETAHEVFTTDIEHPCTHPLNLRGSLHPTLTPGDVSRMSVQELGYFTDAPVAHLVAQKDFLRDQSFERARTMSFERWNRNGG